MRVLSGTQPSGELHIGNYFGALRQYLALQEDHECLYFIADYHSMTSVRDGKERVKLTRDVALDYLGCGLDPARSILYRQSDVPEVCELSWILSTITPMGLLERCHAYKDKLAQGASPNHGLFAYPVLMAADILLFNSDKVPVGQDQKQHLEVTRDLAQRFNLHGAQGGAAIQRCRSQAAKQHTAELARNFEGRCLGRVDENERSGSFGHAAMVSHRGAERRAQGIERVLRPEESL